MATKDEKKKKAKTIVRVVYRNKKRPATASKSGGLPKSVKALLGYLGKSDTALSGSSAPQRAVLAPQVQQQQQQQQPVFRARQATGTIIAKSPLTAIQAAPQPQQPQNIIIKTSNTAKDETKKDDKIPDALSKINEKILGIEDFGKKAVTAVTGLQSSLKRMDQRVKFFEEGWEDVQTLQTPALKSGARPIIKETRFGSAVSLGDVTTSFASISPQRRLSFGGAAAFDEEQAGDAQEFFAQSHVHNVTNPEMQPIVKLRGRKAGTKLTPTTLESFRMKRAATASAKKAQIIQELEQAQSMHLLETAAKKIMIKPKRLLTPRKRAEIDAAMTASAQIEQLVAGGGAAAAHTPVPPAVLRDDSNISVRKERRIKRSGNEGDV